MRELHKVYKLKGDDEFQSARFRKLLFNFRNYLKNFVKLILGICRYYWGD